MYFKLRWIGVCLTYLLNTAISQLPINQCQPLVCESESGDVVFVVDVSDSIDRESLDRIIDVILDIIDQLGIDEGSGFRVGLVTFSSRVIEEIPFGILNAATLRERIRAISHAREGTNTSAALQRARTIVETFGRKDSKTVAILFTDGGSWNHTAAAIQADFVKNSGIMIATVAVGCVVNRTQLEQLSSGLGYNFQIEHIGLIQRLVRQMIAILCPLTGGRPTITLPTPPTLPANLTRPTPTPIVIIPPVQSSTPPGIATGQTPPAVSPPGRTTPSATVTPPGPTPSAIITTPRVITSPPVVPSVTSPPVVPSVTSPPVVPSVTSPPIVVPPVTSPSVVPPVTSPPVVPPATSPPVVVPPVTSPPLVVPPVTSPPVVVPPVTSPPVVPSVTSPPVVVPPVTSPPVVPPVTSPPVVPPVTSPPVVVPPVTSPPVVPSVTSPPVVVPPVTSPPDVPPVTSPPFIPPVTSPPVVPPVTSPPFVPPVTSPPVVPPVTSPVVVPPVTSPPVVPSVTSPPVVVPPVTSPPVVPPVTSPPFIPPVTSPPVVPPVTSPPFVPAVTSPPVVPPVTSPPVVVPPVTSPPVVVPPVTSPPVAVPPVTSPPVVVPPVTSPPVVVPPVTSPPVVVPPVVSPGITTPRSIPIVTPSPGVLTPAPTPGSGLPLTLCDGCAIRNGVGYNPHGERCDWYIQCKLERGRFVQALAKQCPLGLFWSQADLTCRQTQYVSCARDPCRNSGSQLVPDQRDCRAFWRCQESSTFGAGCCPKNTSFRGGQCQPDTSCVTACNVTIIGVFPCTNEAHPTNRTRYFENTITLGRIERSCPPGLGFVSLTCDCSERLPFTEVCKPELYLPFDGNFKDKANNIAVGVEGTKFAKIEGAIGQAAFFSGDARLSIWRFTNADFGKVMLIKFRFRPAPLQNGPALSPEALIANSDCGKKATIEISMDRNADKVIGLIDTEDDGAETKEVSFQQNGWVDVEYFYNKTEFTLQARGATMQRAMANVTGKIRRNKCALQIGYGEGLSNFTGYIDELYIYFCIPENW